MKKIWHDEAWDEYISWLTADKTKVKRINQLLCDIDRNGYTGIGKPEPLKGNLSGMWSRRIDDEHRLIYQIRNGCIEIISCKGHYN